MISPRLRNWLLVVVTVIWAANFIAVLITPLKYASDPMLHTVFMGIVGGTIAASRPKKNGNGS